MVGIVDEALNKGGEDRLQIDQYTAALVKFIRLTDTPMTIGIQGEWGSGKTSLLNQIWHNLDIANDEDISVGNYKQIWINSWESSLLSKPEEALIKIINQIINELIASDTDKSRAESLKNGVKTVLSGALRIGSSITMGAAGQQVAEELIAGNSNTIRELRESLSELVTDIRSRDSNPYEKIIIYVDDLDRIEPAEAVKILELLKNIFNVRHCVFILAIDYQVVIKGLKDKFGEQTPENEWEFRAFFDKIIQLPFKMPMSDYNIGHYVIQLLKDISFYSGEEELDDDIIRNIVELTIGGNPRSIKRLINSLALIKIFLDTSEDQDGGESLSDKDLATTLFAMVCMQIAYPDVYDLLRNEPEFQAWNDELANKITQKKEEDDKTFTDNLEKVKTLEEFNDKWEQALFRICYVKPRLRRSVTKISRLLTVIKEVVPEKNLTSLIKKAINDTAVTSIAIEESPNIRPPKGSYKPHFVDGLEGWFDRWHDDHERSQGLSDEHKEYFRQIINLIKTEFGAKDFSEEPNARLHIKYAGAITIYCSKRKIAGFGADFKRNKVILWHNLLKSPAYNNFPIILNGKELHHQRLFEITDVEERLSRGSIGYIEWQGLDIDPENPLTMEEVKFLIKSAIDVREKLFDQAIMYKDADEQLSNFQNKRKDSKAFKDAVTYLQEKYIGEKIEINL
ncbi:MAG: P-loop NTPase fold protein [Candidatus Marinimicrobia bacterium]|nr:P-loop NTPase fold protein [Candidatus Neomarinimicrobiota bacterium]